MQKKHLPMALEVDVSGIVQGVGFRPFVYNLSIRLGLRGWVLNNSQGVTIHWEGSEETIKGALRELTDASPPSARVDRLQIQKVQSQGFSNFSIRHSLVEKGEKALISPDIGICDDCLSELADPLNRRHWYPFINCTNCGPRFTIVKDIPYDRPLTTMAGFEMCPTCKQEYHNPADRRFHAQPNACPKCGPQLMVLDSKGKVCNSSVKDILLSGKIIAVKGLGGFHLACSALNPAVVSRLRKGKLREKKPFALMASDVRTVRNFCYLSAEEEEYLTSPAKPIVVLKQRKDPEILLSQEINPNLDSLGVMLPYTPLHRLLFSRQLTLLVLTSANLTSDPLITGNEDAVKALSGIADYFIIHNRDIEHQCDDSVGMIVNDSWQFMRRARGYVPLPVVLPGKQLAGTFACGGNTKNTFALAKNDQVFLSQHWGDLDNYLNFEKYKEAAVKMQALLEISPALIVCDSHPEYRSTAYAHQLASEMAVPLIKVQHHHAHMASCMAEHGLDEDVMAVVCDGTGFGTDEAIWGFEFLSGNYNDFQREGHLAYVPLLGGEASIKKPDRMAASFLFSAYGSEAGSYLSQLPLSLTAEELNILEIQHGSGFNSIPTSSCGRLFDAVAAALNICHETMYEGQGPMEMEALARRAGRCKESYQLELLCENDGSFRLDFFPMWEALLKDVRSKENTAYMAYKFHLGVAQGILKGIRQMASKTGLKKVVLSGGVFQNKLLTEMVAALLTKDGIVYYTHNQVPPNDGGIALGQAVVGNEVIKHVSSGTTANNKY